MMAHGSSNEKLYLKKNLIKAKQWERKILNYGTSKISKITTQRRLNIHITEYTIKITKDNIAS